MLNACARCVDGAPKLADIGLVTGVHEERSFVGTEGFIPPEGPGSERADLFGLGRLLYEAATGKNRCDFPGLPDDLDRWPKSEREALIEAFSLLDALSISLETVNLDAAVVLAERMKLSLYDASYLWLAHALGAELVTLDDRLARADEDMRRSK